MSFDTYWRRKLSAYLHDSPDKVINLVDHEGRARSLAQVEGFELTESARKEADHAASAADRLPWPKSRLGAEILCRSDFNAADNALVHPLGKASISFPQGFASAEGALTHSQATRPRIADDDPRAAFLTAWRFWQNWASSADERFACLPAETRLPDHTIWNHLAVTSAMQGCFGGSRDDWDPVNRRPKRSLPDRPAFLLFTLGPVQDFIAAARNTRDLWSGSYLLSYLAGTALAKIAMDFGPDHVIFPNLANQPILDLLLKRDLWDHVKSASGKELWRAFGYYNSEGKERLLTPSLPNRFLALLPANMSEHPQWTSADSMGRSGAARYAADLDHAIRERLEEIGASVAEKCAAVLRQSFDGDRFTRQVKQILEIHWQVLPWPDKSEVALSQAGSVPGDGDRHPLDPVRAIQTMLNRMPVKHRDPRYFREGAVGNEQQAGPFAQVSAAWSGLFALESWKLDAVKATRAFPAWSEGGWQVNRAQNKDSLNGKEETCLTVPSNQEEARKLSEALAGSPHAFRSNDLLGASTLIKRLWHLNWLSKHHPFDPEGHGGRPGDFAMPNTRSIAAHKPFTTNADEETGSEDDDKYFAVLALDGDEMGKWISGIKCPELAGQLSEEARIYFEKYGNAEFLKARRPVSPSFHLQFSELLGNFSQHCARRIVEAFDGRLIYAGGDDVLAMLPADTALACARALRSAFRGERLLPELALGIVDVRSRKREEWKSDGATRLFEVTHEGFIKLTQEAAPEGYGANAGLLSEPVDFPFLVPGSATDCSVGIAIAHFKSPLQDVVRAAQAAEKRAKKLLGRSAVAITLFKRSGETIEWGTQWGSGGLDIYRRMAGALEKGEVSSRFPYRIVALLEAYLTETNALSAKSVEHVPDFDVASVIERELNHVIDRQGTSKEAKVALRKDWLEPMGDPDNPNQLRRFLRWVTEQEARAAARKLAEKLIALADGRSDSSTTQQLRDLADAPICDDSTHQQDFTAIATKLAETGGENDSARKSATKAMESFEKRLPEAQLQAIIGICQTVAFAHRTRSETEPRAERQTV